MVPEAPSLSDPEYRVVTERSSNPPRPTLATNPAVDIDHPIVSVGRSGKENKTVSAILGLKEAIFVISLDDPLLWMFNSDKIKKVMISMNHKEDEVIEHKMITKSIERALKKLDKEGLPEDCTNELRDWYESIK